MYLIDDNVLSYKTAYQKHKNVPKNDNHSVPDRIFFYPTHLWVEDKVSKLISSLQFVGVTVRNAETWIPLILLQR